MNLQAAAEVFKVGDLVTITQFLNHNGRRIDGSSGRIKTISTDDVRIPYISFTLEELTLGDKVQYTVQFPEKIKYENEVLSIKEDDYHYVISPKGKMIK